MVTTGQVPGDGAPVVTAGATGQPGEIQPALREDVPAAMATISAFNRWLEEDWGFAYRDKLFAVPLLSFSDPEEAVRELEWCLSKGARMVPLPMK